MQNSLSGSLHLKKSWVSSGPQDHWMNSVY